MIELNHYLILSGVLFCIGLYGALSKKNAIAILMSIEILFNSVNLTAVALARHTTPLLLSQEGFQLLLTGQTFAIFVVAVAAAEVALGLAIVIAIYRNKQSVDVGKINLLRR